jgi:VanZ family protein
MSKLTQSTTLAWPMTCILTALIVYASLYPMSGWRLPAQVPWDLIWAPWPRYWTRFDVIANFVGYIPLGFLSMLTVLRLQRHKVWWVLACLFPVLLSLGLEGVQVLLPSRVASNLDWALNSAGGLVGALAAGISIRKGWILRWQRWRERCLSEHAHDALPWLALWPVALLYPTSVPFGLGHVWNLLMQALQQAAQDTLFEDLATHLPLQAMPWTDVDMVGCMALGLLMPCLLLGSSIKGHWRRLVGVVLVVLGGSLVNGLSAALTYGPDHAWFWVSADVAYASAMAMVVGVVCSFLPHVWRMGLLLCGVTAVMWRLNMAPISPYFDESVQEWAQGHFIRFHGLTQWIGWLWPYAVGGYALKQVCRWAHSRLKSGA